jgi:hypothetical protein
MEKWSKFNKQTVEMRKKFNFDDQDSRVLFQKGFKTESNEDDTKKQKKGAFTRLHDLLTRNSGKDAK